MISKFHVTSPCKQYSNKLLGENSKWKNYHLSLKKKEKKKCDYPTHNLWKQSMKCKLYIGFKPELA